MKMNFIYKKNGINKKVKIEPIHLEICSICNKSIADEVHHEGYDEDDPIDSTRLMCKNCHAKLQGGISRRTHTRIQVEKEVKIIFKDFYD